MMKKSIVIGIGNDFRKDDGAGLAAAGEIEKLNLPNVRVIMSNGDLTGILEILSEFDSIIIADSVSSGGSPGAVYRIDPFESRYSFQTEKSLSSHRFGIIEILKLAQNIDKPFKNVIFYGIEGEDYSHGEGLSSKVWGAVERAVDRMAEDLTEQQPD